MTVARRFPLRPRRRDLGRHLNFLLDNLFRGPRRDRAASRTDLAAAGLPLILNDAAIGVIAGRIYGRNSSGRIAEAIATATNTVSPLYLALGQAGSGEEFPVANWGAEDILVAGGRSTTAPAVGAVAFLSPSASGTVTFTRPSGTGQIRFVIGRAVEAFISLDGKCKIDFHIPLLGSETL